MINFIEGLLSKIRESQIPIAQVITSGQCKSYDEYRYSAGSLWGLKEAEEIIKQAFEAMTLGKKSGESNGKSNENPKFY